MQNKLERNWPSPHLKKWGVIFRNVPVSKHLVVAKVRVKPSRVHYYWSRILLPSTRVVFFIPHHPRTKFPSTPFNSRRTILRLSRYQGNKRGNKRVIRFLARIGKRGCKPALKTARQNLREFSSCSANRKQPHFCFPQRKFFRPFKIWAEKRGIFWSVCERQTHFSLFQNFALGSFIREFKRRQRHFPPTLFRERKCRDTFYFFRDR